MPLNYKQSKIKGFGDVGGILRMVILPLKLAAATRVQAQDPCLLL